MRRIRSLVGVIALVAALALAWGVSTASAASHASRIHPYVVCPGSPVGC